MVGVSRKCIYKWQQQGKLQLDLVCDICGEPSNTKYCRECDSKGWPGIVYRYGLTLQQLRDMPDKCEVCGATERLNVDHDHATGKYRGILCHGCNVALGHVKEKEETLENLIKYLRIKSNPDKK